MPGVLKDAIDHDSRPHGKSVWAGRPAGVLGVSTGTVAQQHLRTVLAYLDVPTLGKPEVFVQNKDGLYGADGDFAEHTKKFMNDWMNRYVTWVRQHAS